MRRTIISVLALLLTFACVEPAYAQQLSTQLMRTFTAAPSDSDPNTAAVLPTDSTVFCTGARLKNPSKVEIPLGYVSVLFHKAASALTCNVVTWVYDFGEARWASLESTATAALPMDAWFTNLEMGEACTFHQIVSCEGDTVDEVDTLRVRTARR